ncbi:MAG: RNA polymerase sigma factor [Polyangiaceae bacterium]
MSDVASHDAHDAPRARFDAIFEAEFAYMWRSLARLGVPTRDLEDVTHDAFMEVYRRLDTYDAARPIRPWLFAFAFRMASDYRRLARHRVEVIGADAEPSEHVPGAEELLQDKQSRLLVERAVAKIHEERRPVFILHDLDEVPIPEVARTLSIPLNTAYSRLRLARDEFRAAVHRMKNEKSASGGVA